MKSCFKATKVRAHLAPNLAGIRAKASAGLQKEIGGRL